MMHSPKLYMLLLGCRPKGRHTEQHDVFFGIGNSLADLVPAINEFWPEVKGNIHIDAYREVTEVGGYKIAVVPSHEKQDNIHSLFFFNLGGYKKDEFEEYHYKVLAVSQTLDGAKAEAKQTAFYRHTGFTGAVSHIDDMFGIDADDIHEVKDILPAAIKAQYTIRVTTLSSPAKDQWHLGYLPLYKIPQ